MHTMLVNLLVYMFPVETVAKVVVVLLGKLAARTDNTVDDAIVKAVSDGLGITQNG